MNVDLIFRTYYRPLCLYALHYLGDIEAAEDAVQDCFVRLLEAGARPDNARAWLYRAVRNCCIDRLRRHDPLAEAVPTDGITEISDEEAQERSQREAELWTAIAALPPRCREVLLLAKRDGLKYSEIAQRMGITEKTVEHQMSKALRRLRGHADDMLSAFCLLL